MRDGLDIIERVLTGDTGAFRLLVERHERLIFQFARNMLRNVEDAEDLTQEVFVAAFQHLATFDVKKSKLSTWLLTIARNRCCNRMKQRPVNTPGNVDAVDRRPSPEKAVVQSEVWQHLAVALESLPLEQRTAFVLAEIQELPHAEIAAIEGIELGTVKSRVSRARERLRLALKPWQPEAPSPLPETRVVEGGKP